MHSSSRRVSEHPPATPDVHRYRVLAFTSRSEAVAYCQKVSDALESSALAGDVGEGATVWLAATDGTTGTVSVYACDHALAAAGSAGIEATIAGQADDADLPPARCLVIGDASLLPG